MSGGQPPSEDLPTGLWIGTAVFALLAAGALVAGMRLGRSVIVDSANKQIEKAPIEPKDKSFERPLAPAADGEPQRSAAVHWQTGIIAYQRGNVSKAREEWAICRRLDPANENCVNGLAKLEQPPAAAPAPAAAARR